MGPRLGVLILPVFCPWLKSSWVMPQEKFSTVVFLTAAPSPCLWASRFLESWKYEANCSLPALCQRLLISQLPSPLQSPSREPSLSNTLRWGDAGHCVLMFLYPLLWKKRSAFIRLFNRGKLRCKWSNQLLAEPGLIYGLFFFYWSLLVCLGAPSDLGKAGWTVFGP